MTDTVRAPGPWSALVPSAWRDPAARILNVDLLTVLIALLLPWSTSGVAIAAVLWLIALIPTLDVGAAIAEASNLRAAHCIVRIGAGWNRVVGRSLGRTSPRGRSDRQIARAALAALSFRAVVARRLDFHCLSRVLHAADGGVVASRVRPQSVA